MKKLIAAVLLLGCGSVQAFNVTVELAIARALAGHALGEFGNSYVDLHQGTGDWSGSIVYHVSDAPYWSSYSDYAEANVSASHIDDSGEYSNSWEMNLSGSVFNHSAEFIENAGGWPDGYALRSDIKTVSRMEIDQDVKWTFTCDPEKDRGVLYIAGIGDHDCGESGLLSAGRYEIQLISELFTTEPWVDELGEFSGSFSISAIPIPAAVWLFGSALAGLGFIRRKA
jgi:hypothetical protein